MAKVFSTHPPTDDRIVDGAEEYSGDLKERPEYVVTTSEFNDVKARLAMLHNKRKSGPEGSESSAVAQGSGIGNHVHRRRQHVPAAATTIVRR